MIVCLCHRVSDRDIKAAVGQGTCCFEVLQDDLRVASSCGCCHDCAREVFDRACSARGQAVAPQPALATTA
ncbi:MAG: (2Fe-2S)-binding protein [Rubrivivax sp.]|nr:(2Fe-2S)-binding protein [Rubrivivax sp.]